MIQMETTNNAFSPSIKVLFPCKLPYVFQLTFECFFSLLASSTMSTVSYFSRFPQFTPNPRANIEEEFRRHARQQAWNPRSDKYKEEQRKFFISEFNTRIGYLDRDDRLGSWQALCNEVGVNPPPTSITKCGKVIC